MSVACVLIRARSKAFDSVACYSYYWGLAKVIQMKKFVWKSYCYADCTYLKVINLHGLRAEFSW